MAKRFLYVCAALLCLAAVYQVGARNAEGKVTPTLVGMTDYPRAASSAVAIDQALRRDVPIERRPVTLVSRIPTGTCRRP
jgi:hypothetical protein